MKNTILNQLKNIFLLLSISATYCTGQNLPKIDPNIRCIFQDKSGTYWFGTNAAGVYHYDGKTLIQYTVKNGLSNNQIQSIQEDSTGNMWFATGAFGVDQFDRKSFTPFSRFETDNAESNRKLDPNELWFYAGGGAYRLSGNWFAYLPLGPSDFMNQYDSPFNLSRYAVYSILKDKKGNVWFGTQAQGVCRYDGKSFTWFTEKGLEGSAVLALFEDSKGNIWFGNNGAGLFRYDGTNLINFTEEKKLGNSEFKISGKSGPGTLARIYAITEDTAGNLWIGTVDAGVWKYDGTNLSNYTTENGLSSNAVNCIYKDHTGDLWFGTDADGICKFDGIRFTRFEVR